MSIPVLPAILTLAALLAAVIWICGSRRLSKTINKALACLAVTFTAAAVLLCFAAPSLGVVVCRPDGDPAGTVEEFFTELFAGDSAAACAKTANLSGLGTENAPEDEHNALVFEALRDSWSYTLDGACRMDGLAAEQDVTVTCLDLGLVREALKEETGIVLGELAEAASSRDEYLDDDSSYLPEFTDKIYAVSLERVLENAQDYRVSTTLTIPLVYEDGRWLITVDDALYSALCGGIA